jgi:fatty acid desaturase
LIWVPLAFVAGFCVFNCTVLLHEVVHQTIFREDRAPGNRWLGYLYSIPSGISAAQFTRWHLDHHAELGSTDTDPKRAHLTPKINKRWYKLLYFTPALFPIYFRAAGQETATYPPELRVQIKRERRITVAFHLTVAALIGLLAGWAVLLRAYVVPVFFVFPIAFALNRLGQHYDVNPDDVAQWSTLMKPSWFWDRVFLNSNYHLEHHYFPRVPSYNLPQLARLLQPFYKSHNMRAHSYGELVWKYIVLNKRPHSNWEGSGVGEGRAKLQVASGK